MNVSSVLKLITPNVSELLVKDYNEETKALVMFLKMLRFIHIHESFENKHENIRDRLKKLLENTEQSRNFFTSNAYSCIEINFHMMIDETRICFIISFPGNSQVRPAKSFFEQHALLHQLNPPS